MVFVAVVVFVGLSVAEVAPVVVDDDVAVEAPVAVVECHFDLFSFPSSFCCSSHY